VPLHFSLHIVGVFILCSATVPNTVQNTATHCNTLQRNTNISTIELYSIHNYFATVTIKEMKDADGLAWDLQSRKLCFRESEGVL